MSKSRDLPTQLSLSFEHSPEMGEQSTGEAGLPLANIFEFGAARLARASCQNACPSASQESKMLEAVLARARRLDW
jgi:hypothetical protein